MTEEASRSTIPCPSCGRPNRANREICAVCASPLVGVGRAPPRPARVPVAPVAAAESVPTRSGYYQSARGPRTSTPGPDRGWPSAPRSAGYRSTPTAFRSVPATPVRRRRWGLIVVGTIVSLIALLLVLASAFANSAPQTQKVPAGSAWVVKPTTLSSIKASVSWHGGGTSTTTKVYLVSGTPSCSSPGSVVASGTGKSGSFTASLNPGGSYSLYACSSTTYQAMNFTVSLSGGVTVGDVIGIVLFLIGIPLVLVGVRGHNPDAIED